VTNKYDAESAIAALENLEPDIILSDVVMGEMSGYEFCKKIENQPTLLPYSCYSDYS
jgi:response regulator receiver domain